MANHEIGRFRYRMRRADDSGVVAQFTDIDGLFVGTWTSESEVEEEQTREWPDPLTITLVNPSFDSAVEDAAHDGDVALGDILLDVLDWHGRSIGLYWLNSVTIEQFATTPLSAKRASATTWTTKYPHCAAASVWEQWRDTLPTERNLWSRMPASQREGWLEVVAKHNANRDLRDTPRTEIVLDGQFITDLASFFCAVGEAVNGPGGYYGWNTSAFMECLGNGFGTDGDFTVVWEHSEVAQEHLAKVVNLADGPVSYFDMLVACFRYRRKQVVLR